MVGAVGAAAAAEAVDSGVRGTAPPEKARSVRHPDRSVTTMLTARGRTIRTGVTTAATEAMYLMMRHAFAGGYRRYEWKCDQLNAPSKRAAERLGFTFEGVFRNAVVTKGRRRDTAWYSVIVEEWPAVRERLEAWLAPENFDDNGRQKRALTAEG